MLKKLANILILSKFKLLLNSINILIINYLYLFVKQIFLYFFELNWA